MMILSYSRSRRFPQARSGVAHESLEMNFGGHLGFNEINDTNDQWQDELGDRLITDCLAAG
jgi:hypothetical protein